MIAMPFPTPSATPLPKNKGGRPPKYPWRTVQVGESFFVPNRTSQSLHRDISRLFKPRRFKCRKVMVKGVIGIKVERIE